MVLVCLRLEAAQSNGRVLLPHPDRTTQHPQWTCQPKPPTRLTSKLPVRTLGHRSSPSGRSGDRMEVPRSHHTLRYRFVGTMQVSKSSRALPDRILTHFPKRLV